jgi:Na+-transporting methylmalonyl-CoA/oxaloacetate decarboxylase gamma subunit
MKDALGTFACLGGVVFLGLFILIILVQEGHSRLEKRKRQDAPSSKGEPSLDEIEAILEDPDHPLHAKYSDPLLWATSTQDERPEAERSEDDQTEP